MPRNYLILWHKQDLDGATAGSICKYFLPDAVLYPFDYGDEIPYHLITSNTIVYLVDISVSRDEMMQLQYEANDVIWIDHHISAIKQMDGLLVKGSRKDGTAACMLVWNYFSKEDPPKGVELLGRYDVWDLSEEVLNYQYGIRALDLDPNDTQSWNLTVFRDETVPYYVKQGKVIRDYLTQLNKKEVIDLAYEVEFEGHLALVVNKRGINSLYFKDHPRYEEVDLLIPFGFDGTTWRVSLYTTKDNVDCSVIAGKYGGGGHKKAAGFSTGLTTLKYLLPNS